MPRISSMHLGDGGPELIVPAGSEKQVDMIGHAATGPYGHIGLPATLDQIIEVYGIIFRAKE